MSSAIKSTKKLIKTALPMLILIATPAFIAPQKVFAETISGSAHAEIKTSIQISELQAMDFGTILTQNGAADIVSITSNGTINTSTSSPHAGSNARNARFSASGTPNAAISISFQDSVLIGIGGTMALRNFIHDAGTTPAFDSSGNTIFNVGADLDINENQAAGGYSGTYQVTVNYQ